MLKLRSDPLLSLFPFAGSKRAIASEIVARFPESCTDYVEPFGGGLSVFGAIDTGDGARVMLADGDTALVGLWRAVADAPDEVGHLTNDLARALEDDPLSYYKLRDRFNSLTHGIDDLAVLRECSKPATAALQLVLRCNTFNGLWRRSARSGMNVPPTENLGVSRLPGLDRIRAWSDVLRKCALRPWNISHVADFWEGKRGVRDEVSDFAQLTRPPRKTLVYFDPPYINKFSGYLVGGFPTDYQIRLLQFANVLTMRGVHVMWSNSNTPEARALLREHWPAAKIERLEVTRTIAADKLSRAVEKELLACSSS